MRILSPVVGPRANPLAIGDVELLRGGLVGPQAVRGDSLGAAVALHQLLQDLQCCSLVAPLADDWVVGGKDDDVLYGDGGADLVLGNLGADTCDGGVSADTVRGGQGDYSLTGGDGDDRLSGDLGGDTLSGGAGADIFHSFGEAGFDRVVDFNRAEGDRVHLDPGTTYTVSQAGADVVMNMAGGAQMVLIGVQLSALTGDWIFTG